MSLDSSFGNRSLNGWKKQREKCTIKRYQTVQPDEEDRVSQMNIKVTGEKFGISQGFNKTFCNLKYATNHRRVYSKLQISSASHNFDNSAKQVCLKQQNSEKTQVTKNPSSTIDEKFQSIVVMCSQKIKPNLFQKCQVEQQVKKTCKNKYFSTNETAKLKTTELTLNEKVANNFRHMMRQINQCRSAVHKCQLSTKNRFFHSTKNNPSEVQSSKKSYLLKQIKATTCFFEAITQLNKIQNRKCKTQSHQRKAKQPKKDSVKVQFVIERELIPFRFEKNDKKTEVCIYEEQSNQNVVIPNKKQSFLKIRSHKFTEKLQQTKQRLIKYHKKSMHEQIFKLTNETETSGIQPWIISGEQIQYF